MEEEKKTSEKLVEAVGSWIETYRNLITIRIVKESSQSVSVTIFSALATVVIIFVLLFIGLGSAWWVGERLENMKAGFFIVGGVFTVILLILLLMAKKILIPGIRNLLIKKIYEQN
jgi:hypothetical protein